MIELEKTYLAKFLPSDLFESESKEIIDIYIPETSVHPVIRIRKNGDSYEITKKQPIDDKDSSRMLEQTIIITKEEFDFLEKSLQGKRIHKIRYCYKYKEFIAEFDLFQDDLKGLVLIDFEFDSDKVKEKFNPPEFCLKDVTQEIVIAGGMLCGKSYIDIVSKLKKLNYSKLEY